MGVKCNRTKLDSAPWDIRNQKPHTTQLKRTKGIFLIWAHKNQSDQWNGHKAKNYLKLSKSHWCQWWKQAGGWSHPSLAGKCPRLQVGIRALSSPALQYLPDSLPFVFPLAEFCKSWPQTSMDNTEIRLSVEIRVLSSGLLYSDFCIDINQAPAGCKKESISLKKAASPWQPSLKLVCFTNISPISPRMKWCSRINMQQAQHITNQGQIQVCDGKM